VRQLLIRYSRFCIITILIVTASVSSGKKRISEISGADNLVENYRRLQFLAPPVRVGDVLDYDVGYVIIDADDKSWPNQLIKGLIPEEAEDGSESWPFSLFEDAFTHNTYLSNGAGEIIYEEKAVKDYNPEWIAYSRLNLSNSKSTSERKKKYVPLMAPSRIRVYGKFILEDHPEAKEYFDDKKMQILLSKDAALSRSAKSKQSGQSVKSGSAVDLSSVISSLSMGVSKSFSVLEGLGIPDGDLEDLEGAYQDYLYVQIGTEKPFILETSKNVRSLTRASSCTLALFDDGSVTGIGYNPRIFDFCSDKSYPFVKWFYLSSGMENISKIAPDSMNYFMLLQDDGNVLGWGQDNIAEGRNDIPSDVVNAVAVVNDFDYAGAVLVDGRVKLWGNYCPADYSNAVANINNASNIIHGGTFSVVLLDNNNIVAFGMNNYGQTNVPSNVNNVVQVAAGGSHTLALLDDGSVIAWGNNLFGQTNVPVTVDNAVGVAAGNYHSLAVLENGQVVAWGAGDYGSTNVPYYVNNAICVGAIDDQSHALLDNGSASVWGGWATSHEAPDQPISTIAQDLTCRVLELAYSDYCQPSVLTAIIRAPVGSLDGDTDEDGLNLFEETYLFETDPDVKDSDKDGISDGAETEAAFLSLWSASDPAGKLYMDYHAVQVTASDTARAALLKDGTVLIFTGEGDSLQTFTNNCGAISIDASDQWILACLTNGDVNVWLAQTGGGFSSISLGISGAVEVSGGYDHCLVRFADGTVKIYRESGVPPIDFPVEDTSTFCSAITNAVKVMAGRVSDTVLFDDGKAIAGDATQDTYKNDVSRSDAYVIEIVPGYNKYYAVLFSDGQAEVYSGSIKKATTITNIVAIHSDRYKQFLAVAADGTNYHYTYNTSAWSTSVIANDLTDLEKLWWRRDCGVELTTDGDIVAMQNATVSNRKLKFIDAAVTSGTLDQGIALVCSGTDPNVKDSDTDTIADGWEILYNFDPNDDSDPPADDKSDYDDDELSNQEELALGTNPFSSDTDGDGQTDWWEVTYSNAVYSFNPLDPLDSINDDDNDGLTRAWESVYQTLLDDPDYDDDGLNDGQETRAPFLSLWSNSDPRGSIMLDYRAVQVTASDTARAALLADGTVLIFTGEGDSLQTYTNNCGALSIDATDKWIIACLANGDVNIWLAQAGGALI